MEDFIYLVAGLLFAKLQVGCNNFLCPIDSHALHLNTHTLFLARCGQFPRSYNYFYLTSFIPFLSYIFRLSLPPQHKVVINIIYLSQLNFDGFCIFIVISNISNTFLIATAAARERVESPSLLLNFVKVASVISPWPPIRSTIPASTPKVSPHQLQSTHNSLLSSSSIFVEAFPSRLDHSRG
jgi:hypothetical protein